MLTVSVVDRCAALTFVLLSLVMSGCVYDPCRGWTWPSHCTSPPDENQTRPPTECSVKCCEAGSVAWRETCNDYLDEWLENFTNLSDAIRNAEHYDETEEFMNASQSGLYEWCAGDDEGQCKACRAKVDCTDDERDI
uniref:Secreted protein n=1 Tax=Noctiluca scintillans TaxID=2966 RepID=A0A7S1FK08_NOCSC|mmetsp:Transcript_809/g.2318  ORF Transcript_809/g.2318 Transcript_809/m.2318 type:complete len:137 (+) Transcript_809:62-472(+)